MKVFQGSEAAQGVVSRPIVTVGNFDGIHLGHRAILDTVSQRAADLGGDAVVYTFDPHPRKVLHPESAPALLTTLDQKLELLAERGIDAVVVEPFTAAFARTEAEGFIRERLHDQLGAREVYVGYDFHFGRDRAGSMRLLTELGPRLGFAVTIIPQVSVDGEGVNSTRIRELLAEGEPERAARMLGRPFAIRGQVQAGDQRGRTLGFPTANLDPETEVLPAPGVYAGWVRGLGPGAPGGGDLPMVANVGFRPTFKEGRELLVEAHLIDWQGDLYGARLETRFSHRLRGEERFPGPEALRRQIAADIAEARKRLDIG